MKVNIDFETRSTVDLKQAGAHVYAAHPTTEVMCMAWHLEGFGGPLLWWPWQPFPERLAEAIEAGAEVHAWNAAFERLMWPVLERQHGAPPVALEQWRCTMVRALLQGFPAALDHAAPSMGLDVEKDKAGHQLMMRVSKPRKVFGPYDAHYREALERAEEQPGNQLREFTLIERADGRCDVAQWWVTPDRMTRLGQYCVRDVDVERAAGAFLEPIPAGELEGWRMDQRINDRGFYVDMDLVHKAKGLVKPAIDVANRELSRLTGGELKSVTKPNEIRAWLNARLGLELDSIDKQTLSVLLAEHPALAGDSPTDPVAVQVIQLRQAAAKTSTAKLNALIRGTGSDGLFRGGLQYAGAGRTSRWAGRRFQPQNIPRPEWWALEAIPLVMEGDIPKIELLLGNPLEAISSILRSCITARPGHELSVADYNAIEARVAAWLAGAVKILEAYATNQDPYRIMAATIFGYANWRDVPKGGIERFLGKKLILGAQYGLGKRRFWESCREDGLFIERDLADRSIDAYRTDNWQIPAAWRALDDAALYAMQNPYTWAPCLGGKIHFFRDDNYLRMRLPSGRQLSYLYPRLVPDVTPWGAETYKIEFWGWNGMKNRMEWQTMWGGRWMENCLAEGTLVLTDRRGWVPIEQVELRDRVHDGVEFVTHGGLLSKGCQQCIELDGVWMTPDHEVLTDDGWQTASAEPRLYRPEIREADLPPTCRQQRKEAPVGSVLRVRGPGGEGRFGGPEGGEQRPRTGVPGLHPGTPVSPSYQAWDDRSPRVPCLEVDAGQMSAADTPGLAKLRGPGHQSVRGVAGVQHFLGGHGAVVPAGADSRPEGQRWSILPRELSVGGPQGSGEQPPGEPACGPHQGPGAHWPGEDDAGVPVASRPVYDIADAGPRSRFVVLGDEGPFIAHNCCQAISRDLMLDAALRLDREGWAIILSVHDELLTDNPAGERNYRELEAEMSKAPAWAADLPLKVEGWTGHRYRK